MPQMSTGLRRHRLHRRTALDPYQSRMESSFRSRQKKAGAEISSCRGDDRVLNSRARAPSITNRMGFLRPPLPSSSDPCTARASTKVAAEPATKLDTETLSEPPTKRERETLRHPRHRKTSSFNSHRPSYWGPFVQAAVFASQLSPKIPTYWTHMGLGTMANYRAYQIGPDGHIQLGVDLECADDAEAIEVSAPISNRR